MRARAAVATEEAKMTPLIVTHYITFYLANGEIEFHDLTDWRVPLPRFRSLVVVNKAEENQ